MQCLGFRVNQSPQSSRWWLPLQSLFGGGVAVFARGLGLLELRRFAAYPEGPVLNNQILAQDLY